MQILDLRPMNEAPTDGTPVLLKLKDVIDRRKADPFDGLCFVGRRREANDVSGWGFAAPVGHGGWQDDDFEGWKELR